MIELEFLRVGTRVSGFVFRGLVVSVLVFVLQCTASASSGVALAWNRSEDCNVVGYHVYYGPSSCVYTNEVVVGDVTNATVQGLLSGSKYYFAVTAYDNLGLESLPSNEVFCSMPAAQLGIQMVQSNGIPTSVCINSGGSAVGQWTLEQSTDLRTWTPCTAGTNCSVNATITIGAAPRMFFRLKSN